RLPGADVRALSIARQLATVLDASGLDLRSSRPRRRLFGDAAAFSYGADLTITVLGAHDGAARWSAVLRGRNALTWAICHLDDALRTIPEISDLRWYTVRRGIVWGPYPI